MRFNIDNPNTTLIAIYVGSNYIQLCYETNKVERFAFSKAEKYFEANTGELGHGLDKDLIESVLDEIKKNNISTTERKLLEVQKARNILIRIEHYGKSKKGSRERAAVFDYTSVFVGYGRMTEDDFNNLLQKLGNGVLPEKEEMTSLATIMGVQEQNLYLPVDEALSLATCREYDKALKTAVLNIAKAGAVDDIKANLQNCFNLRPSESQKLLEDKMIPVAEINNICAQLGISESQLRLFSTLDMGKLVHLNVPIIMDGVEVKWRYGDFIFAPTAHLALIGHLAFEELGNKKTTVAKLVYDSAKEVYENKGVRLICVDDSKLYINEDGKPKRSVIKWNPSANANGDINTVRVACRSRMFDDVIKSLAEESAHLSVLKQLQFKSFCPFSDEQKNTFLNDYLALIGKIEKFDFSKMRLGEKLRTLEFQLLVRSAWDNYSDVQFYIEAPVKILLANILFPEETKKYARDLYNFTYRAVYKNPLLNPTPITETTYIFESDYFHGVISKSTAKNQQRFGLKFYPPLFSVIPVRPDSKGNIQLLNAELIKQLVEAYKQARENNTISVRCVSDRYYIAELQGKLPGNMPERLQLYGDSADTHCAVFKYVIHPNGVLSISSPFKQLAETRYINVTHPMLCLMNKVAFAGELIIDLQIGEIVEVNNLTGYIKCSVEEYHKQMVIHVFNKYGLSVTEGKFKNSINTSNSKPRHPDESIPRRVKLNKVIGQQQALKEQEYSPELLLSIQKNINVAYEESDLAGITVFHGTTADHVESVQLGPKNYGKGFAGPGLYLAVGYEKDLADEYADIASANSKGKKAKPVTLQGTINPDKLKTLRIGRIRLAKRFPIREKTDLANGIFPAEWSKDEVLRKFMLDNFDIIEVIGAKEAGYNSSSNRFIVIHENAGNVVTWKGSVHSNKPTSSNSAPELTHQTSTPLSDLLPKSSKQKEPVRCLVHEQSIDPEKIQHSSQEQPSLVQSKTKKKMRVEPNLSGLSAENENKYNSPLSGKQQPARRERNFDPEVMNHPSEEIPSYEDKFGVNYQPTLFVNTYAATSKYEHIDFDSYHSAEEIRNLSQGDTLQHFQFVILETGELVISRRYSNLIELSSMEIIDANDLLRYRPLGKVVINGAEHIKIERNRDVEIIFDSKGKKPKYRRHYLKYYDLAKGAAIVSAGQFYMINGKIASAGSTPTGLYGIENYNGRHTILDRNADQKQIVEHVFVKWGFHEASGEFRSSSANTTGQPDTPQEVISQHDHPSHEQFEGKKTQAKSNTENPKERIAVAKNKVEAAITAITKLESDLAKAFANMLQEERQAGSLHINVIDAEYIDADKKQPACYRKLKNGKHVLEIATQGRTVDDLMSFIAHEVGGHHLLNMFGGSLDPVYKQTISSDDFLQAIRKDCESLSQSGVLHSLKDEKALVKVLYKPREEYFIPAFANSIIAKFPDIDHEKLLMNLHEAERELLESGKSLQSSLVVSLKLLLEEHRYIEITNIQLSQFLNQTIWYAEKLWRTEIAACWLAEAILRPAAYEELIQLMSNTTKAMSDIMAVRFPAGFNNFVQRELIIDGEKYRTVYSKTEDNNVNECAARSNSELMHHAIQAIFHRVQQANIRIYEETLKQAEEHCFGLPYHNESNETHDAVKRALQKSKESEPVCSGTGKTSSQPVQSTQPSTNSDVSQAPKAKAKANPPPAKPASPVPPLATKKVSNKNLYECFIDSRVNFVQRWAHAADSWKTYARDEMAHFLFDDLVYLENISSGTFANGVYHRVKVALVKNKELVLEIAPELVKFIENTPNKTAIVQLQAHKIDHLSKMVFQSQTKLPMVLPLIPVSIAAFQPEAPAQLLMRFTKPKMPPLELFGYRNNSGSYDWRVFLHESSHDWVSIKKLGKGIELQVSKKWLKQYPTWKSSCIDAGKKMYEWMSLTSAARQRWVSTFRVGGTILGTTALGLGVYWEAAEDQLKHPGSTKNTSLVVGSFRMLLYAQLASAPTLVLRTKGAYLPILAIELLSNMPNLMPFQELYHKESIVLASETARLKAQGVSDAQINALRILREIEIDKNTQCPRLNRFLCSLTDDQKVFKPAWNWIRARIDDIAKEVFDRPLVILSNRSYDDQPTLRKLLNLVPDEVNLLAKLIFNMGGFAMEKIVPALIKTFPDIDIKQEQQKLQNLIKRVRAIDFLPPKPLSEMTAHEKRAWENAVQHQCERIRFETELERNWTPGSSKGYPTAEELLTPAERIFFSTHDKEAVSNSRTFDALDLENPKKLTRRTYAIPTRTTVSVTDILGPATPRRRTRYNVNYKLTPEEKAAIRRERHFRSPAYQVGAENAAPVSGPIAITIPVIPKHEDSNPLVPKVTFTFYVDLQSLTDRYKASNKKSKICSGSTVVYGETYSYVVRYVGTHKAKATVTGPNGVVETATVNLKKSLGFLPLDPSWVKENISKSVSELVGKAINKVLQKNIEQLITDCGGSDLSDPDKEIDITQATLNEQSVIKKIKDFRKKYSDISGQEDFFAGLITRARSNLPLSHQMQILKNLANKKVLTLLEEKELTGLANVILGQITSSQIHALSQLVQLDEIGVSAHILVPNVDRKVIPETSKFGEMKWYRSNFKEVDLRTKVENILKDIGGAFKEFQERVHDAKSLEEVESASNKFLNLYNKYCPELKKIKLVWSGDRRNCKDYFITYLDTMKSHVVYFTEQYRNAFNGKSKTAFLNPELKRMATIGHAMQVMMDAHAESEKVNLSREKKQEIFDEQYDAAKLLINAKLTDEDLKQSGEAGEANTASADNLNQQYRYIVEKYELVAGYQELWDKYSEFLTGQLDIKQLLAKQKEFSENTQSLDLEDKTDSALLLISARIDIENNDIESALAKIEKIDSAYENVRRQMSKVLLSVYIQRNQADNANELLKKLPDRVALEPLVKPFINFRQSNTQLRSFSELRETYLAMNAYTRAQCKEDYLKCFSEYAENVQGLYSFAATAINDTILRTLTTAPGRLFEVYDSEFNNGWKWALQKSARSIILAQKIYPGAGAHIYLARHFKLDEEAKILAGMRPSWLDIGRGICQLPELFGFESKTVREVGELLQVASVGKAVYALNPASLTTLLTAPGFNQYESIYRKNHNNELPTDLVYYLAKNTLQTAILTASQAGPLAWTNPYLAAGLAVGGVGVGGYQAWSSRHDRASAVLSNIEVNLKYKKLRRAKELLSEIHYESLSLDEKSRYRLLEAGIAVHEGDCRKALDIVKPDTIDPRVKSGIRDAMLQYYIDLSIGGTESNFREKFAREIEGIDSKQLRYDILARLSHKDKFFITAYLYAQLAHAEKTKDAHNAEVVHGFLQIFLFKPLEDGIAWASTSGQENELEVYENDFQEEEPSLTLSTANKKLMLDMLQRRLALASTPDYMTNLVHHGHSARLADEQLLLNALHYMSVEKSDINSEPLTRAFAILTSLTNSIFPDISDLAWHLLAESRLLAALDSKKNCDAYEFAWLSSALVQDIKTELKAWYEQAKQYQQTQPITQTYHIAELLVLIDDYMNDACDKDDVLRKLEESVSDVVRYVVSRLAKSADKSRYEVSPLLRYERGCVAFLLALIAHPELDEEEVKHGLMDIAYQNGFYLDLPRYLTHLFYGKVNSSYSRIIITALEQFNLTGKDDRRSGKVLLKFCGHIINHYHNRMLSTLYCIGKIRNNIYEALQLDVAEDMFIALVYKIKNGEAGNQAESYKAFKTLLKTGGVNPNTKIDRYTPNILGVQTAKSRPHRTAAHIFADIERPDLLLLLAEFGFAFKAAADAHGYNPLKYYLVQPHVTADTAHRATIETLISLGVQYKSAGGFVRMYHILNRTMAEPSSYRCMVAAEGFVHMYHILNRTMAEPLSYRCMVAAEGFVPMDHILNRAMDETSSYSMVAAKPLYFYGSWLNKHYNRYCNTPDYTNPFYSSASARSIAEEKGIELPANIVENQQALAPRLAGNFQTEEKDGCNLAENSLKQALQYDRTQFNWQIARVRLLEIIRTAQPAEVMEKIQSVYNNLGKLCYIFSAFITEEMNYVNEEFLTNIRNQQFLRIRINEDGDTLLHWAIRQRNLLLSRWLFAKDRSMLTCQNSQRVTPLSLLPDEWQTYFIPDQDCVGKNESYEKTKRKPTKNIISLFRNGNQLINSITLAIVHDAREGDSSRLDKLRDAIVEYRKRFPHHYRMADINVETDGLFRTDLMKLSTDDICNLFVPVMHHLVVRVVSADPERFFDAKYFNNLVVNYIEDQHYRDSYGFLQDPIILSNLNEMAVEHSGQPDRILEIFSTWWQETGLYIYLSHVEKALLPLSGKTSERKFNGAFELDILAFYFNCNIKLLDDDLSEVRYVGVGMGIVKQFVKSDTNRLNELLEHDLIYEKNGQSYFSNNLHNVFSEKIQRIPRKYKTALYRLLEEPQISALPRKLENFSAAEYREFITILKQKGIVIADDAYNPQFIMEGDNIAVEKIKKIIENPLLSLETYKLIKICLALSYVPEFEFCYSNGDWGLAVSPRFAAEPVISIDQLPSSTTRRIQPITDKVTRPQSTTLPSARQSVFFHSYDETADGNCLFHATAIAFVNLARQDNEAILLRLFNAVKDYQKSHPNAEIFKKLAITNISQFTKEFKDLATRQVYRMLSPVMRHLAVQTLRTNRCQLISDDYFVNLFNAYFQNRQYRDGHDFLRYTFIRKKLDECMRTRDIKGFMSWMHDADGGLEQYFRVMEKPVTKDSKGDSTLQWGGMLELRALTTYFEANCSVRNYDGVETNRVGVEGGIVPHDTFTENEINLLCEFGIISIYNQQHFFAQDTLKRLDIYQPLSAEMQRQLEALIRNNAEGRVVPTNDKLSDSLCSELIKRRIIFKVEDNKPLLFISDDDNSIAKERVQRRAQGVSTELRQKVQQALEKRVIPSFALDYNGSHWTYHGPQAKTHKMNSNGKDKHPRGAHFFAAKDNAGLRHRHNAASSSFVPNP